MPIACACLICDQRETDELGEIHERSAHKRERVSDFNGNTVSDYLTTNKHTYLIFIL